MGKRFKDPIYGYICIPSDIVNNVIDTAEFQRLRSITQTSYAPLYASAVHNRFVHSLGVYYLGTMVAKSFEISMLENNLEDLENYLDLFKLACLLHDVGHAPFSHTGEAFYLGADSSRDELHNAIAELTDDQSLIDEIKQKNYGAAPHELMSVVVALKTYPFLFTSGEEKSFFARCILGYKYVKEIDKRKSFLNCMILMLNSSIIDVDKLDYLIRDAYITGYDTVKIDYTRLLQSVRVIDQYGFCKLAYTKNAISVIESAIFAHDAERKWIQSHPIVLYDAYLLKHGIECLNNNYDIFNYESLSAKGKLINNGFRVSLLSDGDITFLMSSLNLVKLAGLSDKSVGTKKKTP